MTIQDLLEKLKDVPLTMEIEGHFIHNQNDIPMRFDSASDDETGVRLWWGWWGPRREKYAFTCEEFLGAIEGYEPETKMTGRYEIEQSINQTDGFDLKLSEAEVSISGNVATIFWEKVKP